ncbi:MAG: hypothetical protein FWG48_04440 [Oscillospiraceae bacterium]|nr:hypothetical protein [Oscillospiraceae bacterium]
MLFWFFSRPYFIVCVVATLTLQVYVASIDRTQQQLDNLPDAMPVFARVGSLNGQRFDMLQIDAATVDGLLASHFVRDLKLTVMLSVSFADKSLDISSFSNKELAEILPYYFATGISSTEALEGLETDDIAWLPGYGPEVFFGDENVCVLDRTASLHSGYSLGDNIEYVLPTKFVFNEAGLIGDEFVEPPIMLRVIGITDLIGFQARATDKGTVPHGLSTVVIPFETARTVLKNSKTNFTASSASFYVNDTHRLNEFKDEMIAMKLEESSTSDSIRIRANRGTSLRVEDASFISAATRLRESLSLLRGFLPLVVVALAVIGCLVAYLAIQSRREEYAVYRLLGLGRPECFFMYFVEIAALTLVGSFFGASISILSGIGALGVGVLVFMLFAGCFSVGSIIALLRLGRTNVMLALTQAE